MMQRAVVSSAGSDHSKQMSNERDAGWDVRRLLRINGRRQAVPHEGKGGDRHITAQASKVTTSCGAQLKADCLFS
jgi:hypothetical protein